MNIIWTKHAEERQKEWEKKLFITKEVIEALLRSPEQIVSGDMNVLIAQTKVGGGLLRVPFIDMESGRKVLTVYWTSKVEKYWKGGKT
ncbi:MAG: hypothetical protein N2Z74_04270 [Syntrophales bacterium]|nr:hypothetical protein [Syntrophales bacterium]